MLSRGTTEIVIFPLSMDARPKNLYQFSKANQRVIFQTLPRGGFTDRQARQLGWDSSVELGNFLIKLNNKDPEAVWLARALDGDESETINQIAAKVDAGQLVPVPRLTHTSLKRISTVSRARTLRDHLRLVSEHHLPYGDATWQGTVRFTLRAIGKSGHVKELPYELPVQVGAASHAEEMQATAEEKLDELQHASDFDKVEISHDSLYFEGLDPSSRRPVPLREIKMREVFVLGINGLVDNETWDSHQGVCTYDALKSLYGKVKGLIKFFRTPEPYFDAIKRLHKERDLHDVNYDPRLHGVCAVDICSFCRELGIPCIALDANGSRVISWVPRREDRREKAPTLVYRIQGNHMHIDAKAAKSISHSLAANSHLAPQKPKVKSVDIDKLYTLLGPAQTGLDHLRAHIAAKQAVPKDVYLHHGNVVGWKADNLQYLWDHNGDLERAKQMVQNMGREWRGETMTSVLMELINEVFGGRGLPKCQPIPAVRDLLVGADVKNKAPYGLTRAGMEVDVAALFARKRATAWDIESCHATMLRSPPEGYCLPGPHDDIIYISEDEQATFTPPGPGMYMCRVYEPDHALFRQGLELCFRPVVCKARKLGLRFDVVLYVPCSITLPRDVFVPLLDCIVKASGGQKDIYKKAINCVSGLLGKTRSERYTTYIDRDLDAVYDHYFDKMSQGHQMLPSVTLGDRTILHAPTVDPRAVPEPPQPLCQDYWLYRSKVVKELVEVSVPIYLQVLDNQRLAVLEMEQIQGGVPLLRKTDCSVLLGGRPPASRSTVDWAWRDKGAPVSATWGRYRPATCPTVTTAIRPSKVADPRQRPTWVHHDTITDSNQVDDVLQLLDNHKGLLLEGVMGGGKSWLTMRVVNHYLNQGKEALVMSFSNMAADNIGGKTIHRGLGIARSDDPQGGTQETFYSHKWLEQLGKNSLIVCDEIGLNPAHIWSMFSALVQFHPDIHILLVGDRHQCSYVEPGASSKHKRKFPHYFDHPTVQHIARGQYVCLTVRHRSKCSNLDAVLDHLKAGGDLMNCGHPLPIATSFTKLNLAFTNTACKRVNAAVNAMEFRRIRGTDMGRVHLPATDHGQEMTLFKGALVQAKKTKRLDFNNTKLDDGKNCINNNELFEVVRINNGSQVIMQSTRRRHSPGSMSVQEYTHRITVPKAVLQQWFELGYCITIHSAQGRTFTEPFTVWEVGHPYIDLRVLYTAVGRAQRLDQIHLPPVDARHLDRFDQCLMEKDLKFLSNKLSHYRCQDRRNGFHHQDEENPKPADLYRDLHASGFCCEHCCVGMVLKTNVGADKQPRQWTLQRLNKPRPTGHVIGNLAMYCYECNVAKPEITGNAPVDAE